MSNQKTNSNHSILNLLVTIVTLLCLVAGTVTVERQCLKIFETGIELMLIRSDATRYNASYRKTDEMTAEFESNDYERQLIYNSDDTVIRVFSNLPTILKLLVWLVAMAAIICVPFLVLLYILKRIYAIKKRYERRKKAKTNGIFSKGA